MTGIRTSARPKLDALTSLRFFAAAMIVLLHASGQFGPAQINMLFSLGGGVSFFFVLSGFVLTYSYPDLPRGRDVARFLWRRFARLWPAYVVGIALSIAVTARYVHSFWMPEAWKLTVDLLMIQTWIPFDVVISSLNSPSWSISTEFGFYLLFPLLLTDLRNTWRAKLAMSLGVAAVMIAVPTYLNLPYGSTTGLSSAALIYFNPLGRLFEFVLGMSAADLWMRHRQRVEALALNWTALEIATVTLVLANLAQMTHHANNGYMPWLSWLDNSGSTGITGALLIFVFAFQRGRISRTLARGAFVLLGEISYSVYLLHYPLLALYAADAAWLTTIAPAWSWAPLYVAALLLLSWLTWRLVEVPVRRVAHSLF